MDKIKIRPINVMYWIALAVADVFIYMVLVTSLMGYDDNYDSSKGDYGSLGSMNTMEKIFYLLFIIWNVFNAGLIIYIGFKVYRTFKPKPLKDS